MIYTLGYARWTLDEVEGHVREHASPLVDTRLKPYSRKPGFNKQDLATRLGPLYVHVPGFGNVNYKGGPIRLKNFEAGRAYLERRGVTPPITLMCGCADEQKCHRSLVAERLAEAYGVEVEHLRPVDRGGQNSLW